MLKIQKATIREVVVFTLSGRIKAEEVAELQRLFEGEADVTAWFWLAGSHLPQVACSLLSRRISRAFFTTFRKFSKTRELLILQPMQGFLRKQCGHCTQQEEPHATAMSAVPGGLSIRWH